MGIMEVRINVHNRILALRSISNILLSDKYQLCHDKASTDVIQQYVDAADPAGLTKYMNHLISQNDLPTSMRDLRIEAKRLAVPYYASMNRTKLIEAIKNAQRPKTVAS